MEQKESYFKGAPNVSAVIYVAYVVAWDAREKAQAYLQTYRLKIPFTFSCILNFMSLTDFSYKAGNSWTLSTTHRKCHMQRIEAQMAFNFCEDFFIIIIIIMTPQM